MRFTTKETIFPIVNFPFLVGKLHLALSCYSVLCLSQSMTLIFIGILCDIFVFFDLRLEVVVRFVG